MLYTIEVVGNVCLRLIVKADSEKEAKIKARQRVLDDHDYVKPEHLRIYVKRTELDENGTAYVY